MSNNSLTLSLLLACLLALVSCGSEDELVASLSDPVIGEAVSYSVQQEDAVSRVLPQLPAPSSIARGSSQVEDGYRIRSGSSVAATLPSSNTASAVFMPQMTQQSTGLTDAAYNGYEYYALSGYEGDARIRVYWLSGPSQPGNEYIALANFQTDRWDWFRVQDGEINAGDCAPYISEQGRLYVMLLLLGNEQCSLDWLILGDDVAPYVNMFSDLEQDKLLNIAPRVVTFNATIAEGYGQELLSWDFDFESDGTWDVLGNTEGLAIHNYEAGNYTASVRLTGSSGKQGMDSISFAIIDPNNQPPQAQITADKLTGDAPLHVGLDALASSDADGTITKYEWDFNNDGEWDLVADSPDIVYGDLVAWGANVVTLRVTDNFYAQDTDTEVINLDHGWYYSFIDQDVGLNTEVAMCATNEGALARSSVAYADYKTGALRYCRAIDAEGTMWGTIREPLTKPSTANIVWGVDIAYSGIVDAPIISMVTQDFDFTTALRSVTAQDANGSAWNPDLSFAEELEPQFWTSLAIINNIPVVAAVADNTGFGHRYLIMARALDASASDWGPAKLVAGGDPDIAYWDVSLLPSFNGSDFVPLLAYAWNDNSGFHASVLRSIDNLGNSWEQPDHVHSGPIYDCSMIMLDGRPALAAGSSSQYGELYFGRSGDAKGQTWPQSAQLPLGGSPVMAVWGGLPVIAYRSFGNGGLWVSVGIDAQGSTWQEPLLVDNRDGHGRYVDILVLNEQLMLCYAGAEDSLICASWQ